MLSSQIDHRDREGAPERLSLWGRYKHKPAQEVQV